MFILDAQNDLEFYLHIDQRLEYTELAGENNTLN